MKAMKTIAAVATLAAAGTASAEQSFRCDLKPCCSVDPDVIGTIDIRVAKSGAEMVVTRWGVKQTFPSGPMVVDNLTKSAWFGDPSTLRVKVP